jgi:hypothetical protein
MRSSESKDTVTSLVVVLICGLINFPGIVVVCKIVITVCHISHRYSEFIHQTSSVSIRHECSLVPFEVFDGIVPVIHLPFGIKIGLRVINVLAVT